MKYLATQFLVLLLFSTTGWAGQKFYDLDVNDVKGFKGEVFESNTKISFRNTTDMSVRLILDANLPEGRRVVVPEGASLFTANLSPDSAHEVVFTVNGFYRMVLEFSDGSLGTGEFAVIGDEIVDIKIVGIAFNPQNLTVKPGTWVRWINTTSMVHTVTTDKSLAFNPDNALVPNGVDVWHSGNLQPGDVYIRQLTAVGDYKYFCKPHERMGHVGSVTVVDN